MNLEPNLTSQESGTNPHRVTFIGIGGAGGRIAEIVGANGTGPVVVRAVDTDSGSLDQLGRALKTRVGGRVTRGLGCGGDAAHARELAEGELPALRELVSGGGLLVLGLGLGGGAGAGMAPVLARLAREAGAVVIAVTALPFDFEGKMRRTNAENALAALKAAVDAVVSVPQQGFGKFFGEGVPAAALMARADEFMAEVITGLLQMVSTTALVPLGAGDLERVLRGRQSDGVAAVVHTAGEERVTELWNRLGEHPFLQSGTRLANAEALLLHVLGGPELRLEDLEVLQREAARCAPHAQLLVGVATDHGFAGHLQATLVAVRGGVGLAKATEDSVVTEIPPRRANLAPSRAMIFEDDQGEPSGSGGVFGRVQTDARNPGAVKPKVGAANRSPRQQQQFDFAPAWRGLFDQAESTLVDGENLDEPTYARRGVRLN